MQKLRICQQLFSLGWNLQLVLCTVHRGSWLFLPHHHVGSWMGWVDSGQMSLLLETFWNAGFWQEGPSSPPLRYTAHIGPCTSKVGDRFSLGLSSVFPESLDADLAFPDPSRSGPTDWPPPSPPQGSPVLNLAYEGAGCPGFPCILVLVYYLWLKTLWPASLALSPFFSNQNSWLSRVLS